MKSEISGAEMFEERQPINYNLFFVKLAFRLFKQKVLEIPGVTLKDIRGGFTLHGSSHSAGVERCIQNILARSNKDMTNQPTELERVLLSFCAWSHDLGMLPTISDMYQGMTSVPLESDAEWRQKHDLISAWYLKQELAALHGKLISAIAEIIERNPDAKKRHELICQAFGDIEDGLIDKAANYFNQKEQHAALEANLSNLAHTINLISRYHRRSENLDCCPVIRHFMGERVRTQFLASIFRLADALDVDRARFSTEIYEYYRLLAEFSHESRLHWMKSFVLSSIDIKDEENALEIQLDMPAEWNQGPLTRELDLKRMTLVQEMAKFIQNDLEEDILSTSKILLEYGFSPLLKVIPHTHFIPAMNYADDIWNILGYLSSSTSPNTSRLIDLSLQGLDKIDQKLTTDEISAQLAIRLGSIDVQLQQRPCHEGLRKLKNLLKNVVGIFSKEGKEGHELSSLRHTLLADFDLLKEPGTIDGSGGKANNYAHLTESVLYTKCILFAQQTFQEQRKEIDDNIKSRFFNKHFDQYDHILLYGYSNQAIKLLTAFFGDNLNPRIHIFECRTKSRYTASNRIIYHDAYKYSLDLREQIGPEASITVYPDAAVGHILNDKIGDKEKALILFGSNGIDQMGTFVHSMGHLTIASIAKCPRFRAKAKVAVLTDGMKIAMPHEVFKQDNRGRNKDNWLSSNRDVVDEMLTNKIKLRNYREDHVPIDLIDYIVILDKKVLIEMRGETIIINPTSRNPASHKKNEVGKILGQYSVNVGIVMKEKFAYRLVASLLSDFAELNSEEAWRQFALNLNEKERCEQKIENRNWFAAKRLFDNPGSVKSQNPVILILQNILRQPDTKKHLRDFSDKLFSLWEKNLRKNC